MQAITRNTRSWAFILIAIALLGLACGLTSLASEEPTAAASVIRDEDPAPAEASTVEQLPIHVVYVNHVEVENVIDYFPPLSDGSVYTATPAKYAFTSGQLDWEIAQAEAVDGYISFHASGAYAERAAAAGHQTLWAQRLADGHTVDVHFHKFLRGPASFQWTHRESPTQAEIVQAWQDNHDLVASLVGTETLWVGESHYSCPACWEDLGYRLRATEQMALLPAGQHIVWLVERDPSGVITYPHFPQIGLAEWHGPPEDLSYFDLRVPQLKKEFLMLYLEWLERERLELAPQVWAWGWCNHGGWDTERYAAEIEEMLTWLSADFVGQTSPRGNVIVEFVSDHQLSDVYEAYEQAGGQPLPSPLTNVNDQFPYMADALEDAGVVADLSDDLGLAGIRLFELERDPPENPPPGAPPRVYLLFRETDGADTVDISAVLASRGVDAASLTLIDVVDGSTSQVDASSLLLGPTPLVLEANATDYPDSPFGFLDAPPLPDNYAELGNEWIVPGFGWARWENIETTAGEYDWSAIDLTNLQQMDATGIRVIPELRSVNPLYGTSWDVDEYPDGNVVAWEDFVAALVEKFDGDGVDDLEGTPAIKVYSFLHELAPSGINYWTDHPDEYAEMFDATYRAMKAACPDCVLFLPGGNLEHFQFQDEGALVDGWIVKVLGYLEGFTTQFDDMGFDYHFWASTASYDDPYSDGTDYRFHERLIEVIRHCYERFGYTDMPIICRESGMTGIGNDGSYTPNEPLQAAYVVKMYTLIASLGQKVCAWTTTLEYAHGPTPGHLFRHMGLIHNPANPDGLSHRKLAWYTYKKMTETLDGADWDNVVTVVDGVDNVYVYRFDVNGDPVYIAWWDYFDESGSTLVGAKPITLTGLSGTAITVTHAVPAADSGLDVTDYTTAFTVTTHLVSDGAVTILLGEDPVLVEGDEQASFPVYLPLVLR